ncbi:CG43308, partial [Drosophila busckii]
RYVQPARKIMKDLRKELYHEGDSEQCHTKNFTDWQEYQECAAKRNQRLEFLIPNYPQKQ